MYTPLEDFTTAGLGVEKGKSICNIVNRIDSPFTAQYMRAFDSLWDDHERFQDVTQKVLESIEGAFKENAPEVFDYVGGQEVMQVAKQPPRTPSPLYLVQCV